MINKRALKSDRQEKRNFPADLFYEGSLEKPAPAVIFLHGIKGFKDWGHWPAIGEDLAARGFIWAPLNFSHDGTATEKSDDIHDLGAFRQNTYSQELQDVLDFIEILKYQPEVDNERISIIGHSRGGPIAMLAANHSTSIKALVTWASVLRLDYAWLKPGFINRWKERGFYEIENTRTGDTYRIDWSMFEDFVQNDFSYTDIIPPINKPYLILHGTEDEGVSANIARDIHAIASTSELSLIEGADHVFGGRHPWIKSSLPTASHMLVERTARFLHSVF